MATESKDFIIVTQPSFEVPMRGSSTIARRRHTLGGDIVEKRRARQINPKLWNEDVAYAKSITDQLRAMNNPAYDVPRTYVSHGKVYEDFVAGTKVFDLPDDYIANNKDWIIPAFANFIHDMSKLRPVKVDEPKTRFPGLYSADLAELTAHLKQYSEFIGDDDINLMLRAYQYLCHSPSINESVFFHSDLHGGNVIIDRDKKRVAFIDFAMADYMPKFWIMYEEPILSVIPGVWDYIDAKLKDSDFTWGYSAVEREIFLFLTAVERAIYERDMTTIKRIPVLCNVLRDIMSAKNFKFQHAASLMGTLSHNTATAIVPASHYGRD